MHDCSMREGIKTVFHKPLTLYWGQNVGSKHKPEDLPPRVLRPGLVDRTGLEPVTNRLKVAFQSYGYFRLLSDNPVLIGNIKRRG